MRKGYNPKTINRTKLLETFLDQNVSLDTQLEISRTMVGKSEEEKEMIAASLLKKYEKMVPASDDDPEQCF